MDSTKKRATKPVKTVLGRALVVEDDAILAMALETALLDGGAEQVVLCNAVSAAIAELEPLRPDILILDVHLADRDDGWAMAELVTALNPRPPIIIFSTGNPEVIPSKIAQMGVVLEKPYDPARLIEILRREQRRPGLLKRLRTALSIN